MVARRLAPLAAALALACGPALQRPSDGATAFAVDDPALAAAVRDAAEDWARAGLDVASYVTVNAGEPGAVPVRAVPRERLPFACFPSRSRAESARQDPAASDGCVAARDGRFVGLFVADDLAPGSDRFTVVMRHELIHVLVPDAPHLDDEALGVLHPDGNSRVITIADLRGLEPYAAVTFGSAD